jgi:hypothetical protein
LTAGVTLAWSVLKDFFKNLNLSGLLSETVSIINRTKFDLDIFEFEFIIVFREPGAARP